MMVTGIEMTTPRPRSLLVVLAHPDDESFPMGGTLAKYAAEGVRVSLICATRGEAGIPGLLPEATGQLRERELRAAAATLGLAEVRFLGYHDGQLAQADPEQAIGQLVKAMREIQPQAVITFGPDGISAHPDHLAIHRFTTQAFDRANLPGRLFYLAPSEATLQGCGVVPSQEVAGGPVAAIDVGDYLVTKVRAMQCHASQKPPYPGLPEEEATRLTCHEYFTVARPVEWQADLADLFEQVPILPEMQRG
jgi:LmbE family N-acetylglucosaminyl deacetylase